MKDTQQRKALQELEESREFERYSRPIRTQKDRISAKRGKIARNSRLPHVLFASTLEDVIFLRLFYKSNSSSFFNRLLLELLKERMQLHFFIP